MEWPKVLLRLSQEVYPLITYRQSLSLIVRIAPNTFVRAIICPGRWLLSRIWLCTRHIRQLWNIPGRQTAEEALLPPQAQSEQLRITLISRLPPFSNKQHRPSTTQVNTYVLASHTGLNLPSMLMSDYRSCQPIRIIKPMNAPSSYPDSVGPKCGRTMTEECH